ncbi:transposable element Tcb1 transposase [Trichonephila clavipes]|nr:transposable element Tcb1 transposase [Trichonephila clavipes]
MSFTRRQGSGRPRQTSRREDHHIVRNARVQPTASSAATQAQPSTPSFGVVPRSRKLDCSGMEQGRLWRGESRFNLSNDDNRFCDWRPRGERLNPAFALQRHTAPTAGVMVWGAIAYNTRLPLVLIRGTMTAQWYVRDILQPHVLPLMQRIPGAIFLQDNAQAADTATVSQGFLRTVNTLLWPARSPDLFLIEHIWDHLGRRVGHPTSLNEEARLQQIWNEISQKTIQNLYALMPDRIASCTRAAGGSTGY